MIEPSYYRGAHAAVVAFDVTNDISFDGASCWLKAVQQESENDSLIVAIVANKVDLPGRVISTDHALKFVNSLPQKPMYFETSAKTGQGVSAVYEAIASAILERKQQHSSNL
ncbi:hypothetical protein Pelo_18859 [Pelomyxa schiedti]|nr:hypothetical protein Pelo_18859 [Pelomyxa schiedti]